MARRRRRRDPMLLFYMERDPCVRLHEAQQLVETPRANGIEHELHVLPEEGHFVGDLRYASRSKMVELTEWFFAAHLGGRAEI